MNRSQSIFQKPLLARLARVGNVGLPNTYRFLPMPPMPRIPRTLPWGSWPRGGGGAPFQWPLRSAIIAMEFVSRLNQGHRQGGERTCIEASQSAKNKKHVCICRRIINGCWDVRDSYIACSTSMDVDLIVSSAYFLPDQLLRLLIPPNSSMEILKYCLGHTFQPDRINRMNGWYAAAAFCTILISQ